ncbi:IS110 family transposase [Mycolicibacterium sp. J2]|jgi:transposase|uniref:IS110 family transposase n=1 Tax=Mycolicibacterium sp. J2 TaxID=2993511 RepID=UPI00224A6C9B|nr:IS110 family transposase [Mycolicibacterium sp. J2]MCX2712415.1 IS110 family transposase [Mycolicibacterium sp. J2]
MALTLGIDVAVRAAHQATLARDGTTVWRGRKFVTTPVDLDRLWADLDVADAKELTVVVEPTRNAWIVLAEWFRRRGARVVMVPTTQSADLRKYYSKHTKNDRIDSELLARLPLLHPEGLREYSGQGPADPLRRLVKQRSTMVKRRVAVYARLDALVELLGPAWYGVLGSNYGIAALEFLTRYADPHAVIRLGQGRLSRFLIARSRGAWREDHAAGLIAAAKETLVLWGTDGMNFAELAEDIAHEAEQALFLTRQIKQIDERIANLYADADPDGIVASAPGVGPVISAVIAGRIGDPHRFTSLAAIRAYTGLVPTVSQSGVSKVESSITKAGDPLLREMLCAAADQARKVDPQIAAKYQRLMTGDRHHDSAICHLGTLLVTRIATCMRTGQPYALRDVDGTPITEAQGRAIVKDRYQIDPRRRDHVRHHRMRVRRKQAAGQESQESPSAPTSRPANTHPTSQHVA